MAGAGSPYDVTKRDHLMQSEAASLDTAPSSVKLHGAGGDIESDQVATAHLKTLHGTVHPWALDDCSGLSSVGFTCRRAGYSSGWPAYSDFPVMRTPSGEESAFVNILDVPHFIEEAKHERASPQCHAHVAHMLAFQGAPATADADEKAQEAEVQPLHPMLPAIAEFSQEAAEHILDRLSSQVAPGPRATPEVPDAVAKLSATHDPIEVLMVERKGAKRFQLPPKDVGVSWSMLTHRVTMDMYQGEVLDVQFAWAGDPADGVKNRYINAQPMAADVRTYLLWTNKRLDPEELQREEADRLQLVLVDKGAAMGSHPNTAA